MKMALSMNNNDANDEDYVDVDEEDGGQGWFYDEDARWS